MKSPRSRSPLLGYLCIALAAALWGSLGVVSRVMLRSGVQPLELSVWRASIAGLLFATHALARGKVRIARADVAAMAAFAVIGVSLFYVSYLFAVREGGAALAAILLYTAPAWVAIASALWLHEPMTGRKLAALALTLVGVAGVALGAPGGGSGLHVGATALGWGLLSGVCYASYYLFGKRYFVRYEAATIFMYVLPLGAALLVPAVHWAPKSGVVWIGIAFLGIVPTYVALQLYEAGLKRVEATRGVTVATLEPVIAALLAYAVWGEALQAVGYAGAVLVLAGVLLMSTESASPAADPSRTLTA